MKTKNGKLANICGWAGCVIGVLIIFGKIVCYYVLSTIGHSPATTVYVIQSLDADVLAFVAGIPLGVCAWCWGRRDLGAIAIVLCAASLAETFARVLRIF